MSQSSQDHPTFAFPRHFDGIEGPRRQAKVTWPLNEIFLLVSCAVISGSGGWTSIALHGEKKLEFLRRRRFLPFRDGTPCHDQLGHDQLGHDQLGMLFSRLDMEGFQRRFIAWLSSLHETLEGVVAIDGKTLRRSFDTNSSKAPSI